MSTRVDPASSTPFTSGFCASDSPVDRSLVDARVPSASPRLETVEGVVIAASGGPRLGPVRAASDAQSEGTSSRASGAQDGLISEAENPLALPSAPCAAISAAAAPGPSSPTRMMQLPRHVTRAPDGTLRLRSSGIPGPSDANVVTTSSHDGTGGGGPGGAAPSFLFGSDTDSSAQSAASANAAVAAHLRKMGYSSSQIVPLLQVDVAVGGSGAGATGAGVGGGVIKRDSGIGSPERSVSHSLVPGAASGNSASPSSAPIDWGTRPRFGFAPLVPPATLQQITGAITAGGHLPSKTAVVGGSAVARAELEAAMRMEQGQGGTGPAVAKPSKGVAASISKGFSSVLHKVQQLGSTAAAAATSASVGSSGGAGAASIGGGGASFAGSSSDHHNGDPASARIVQLIHAAASITSHPAHVVEAAVRYELEGAAAHHTQCEAAWRLAVRGVPLLSHATPSTIAVLRRLARKYGVPTHLRSIVWLTITGVAQQLEEAPWGPCAALLKATQDHCARGVEAGITAARTPNAASLSAGAPASPQSPPQPLSPNMGSSSLRVQLPPGIPSDVATIIERDLERTFPDHPFFHDSLSADGGYQKLRRVLYALWWRQPGLGYCQSFNFLAAFLLIMHAGDEEAAFVTLCVMIERMLPVDFYSPELTGLKVDQQVLGDLVALHLPRLAAHFRAIDFDVAVLAPSWLMGWYLNTLPIEAAVLVWDYIFSQGHEQQTVTLLSVALALLKTHQTALLTVADASDVAVDISKLAQATFDGGALVTHAHAFKITPDQVAGLRRKFRVAILHEDVARKEQRRAVAAAREAKAQQERQQADDRRRLQQAVEHARRVQAASRPGAASGPAAPVTTVSAAAAPAAATDPGAAGVPFRARPAGSVLSEGGPAPPLPSTGPTAPQRFATSPEPRARVHTASDVSSHPAAVAGSMSAGSGITMPVLAVAPPPPRLPDSFDFSAGGDGTSVAAASTNGGGSSGGVLTSSESLEVDSHGAGAAFPLVAPGSAVEVGPKRRERARVMSLARCTTDPEILQAAVASEGPSPNSANTSGKSGSPKGPHVGAMAMMHLHAAPEEEMKSLADSASPPLGEISTDAPTQTLQASSA